MKEYQCPKCKKYIKWTTEKQLQHALMVHNRVSIECSNRAKLLLNK